MRCCLKIVDGRTDIRTTTTTDGEWSQKLTLSFQLRWAKNNVYPCKPQFYYIKVGFKGVKIIYVCFCDGLNFLKFYQLLSNTVASNKRPPPSLWKIMMLINTQGIIRIFMVLSLSAAICLLHLYSTTSLRQPPSGKHKNGSKIIKLFFMLHSAEHVIYSASLFWQFLVLFWFKFK